MRRATRYFYARLLLHTGHLRNRNDLTPWVGTVVAVTFARSLARARARQRRRFLSSESSFHIPGSQVAVRRRRLGGRWNTRGPIQITGLPSYPGSFFLSPSPSSYLPPSLSLFLHLPGLILRHFFFFAFCPPSRFFFLFYIPRLCPSQSQSQLLLYLFHLSLFPSFPSFVFEFWRRS